MLAIAYFALGTGSLAVVGLLQPMATSLGASPTQVAQLVTVFALTFALMAPTLQVLFSHWPRRTLLVAGLFVSAAGALGAAFAPTLGVAMIARVVMALGAAAVGPMASALAAHGVPAGQQVRALSFVFGGLIFSTVLGVPLATWVGQALSWPGVFIVLAMISLACVPAVLRTVHERSAGQSLGVAALFGTLREPRTAASVVATLLQTAGQFSSYTLIAPLLIERYGLGANHVSLALLAFGVGGVGGNALGGRLGDRGNPTRLVWISLVGMVLVFAAMSLVPRQPAVGLALFVAWAVLSMLFQAPQQKRMLGFAPQAAGLVLALNSSAIYLGMSIGAFASALALHAFGTGGLPVVSMCFVAAAALSHARSQRLDRLAR